MPIQRPRILHAAQMAGKNVIAPRNLDVRAQSLTNRNVIINGAMNVAQRGTSSTGLGASNGYFTCDRWRHVFNTSGRLTSSQSTDAPVGFANSLKFECTTADTSIAAGEYFFFQHKIEGQNLQHFAKGTSSAKAFAVSFYVKGNASATYALELFDGDNTRSCSKSFNVTTSWNRVELIFPADTTGAFDDDNAASLTLSWWLHAGTDFTSGTLNSSAFATNNNVNRALSTTSFFDSTDRTFFITGVQLEPVQVTEFEHEPFDVTLRKCHRYFESIGYTAGSYVYAASYAYSNNSVRAVQHYKVKRATPSFTFDNQGDVIIYYNGSDQDTDPSGWNYHDIGLNSCRVTINMTGVTTTAGYATAVYVNGSSTYNVKVDAEL